MKRQLTDAEIEVILDRVFNPRRRLGVEAELKSILVDDSVLNAHVEAGSKLKIDLETLADLVVLRETRRKKK